MANYPKQTMQEKLAYHRQNAKGAIPAGSTLSERDKKMQSLGYLKHADQSYDIYLYKNNKEAYNKRKAEQKAWKDASPEGREVLKAQRKAEKEAAKAAKKAGK